MDWKEVVIEKLGQYEAKCIATQLIPKELKMLEEKAGQAEANALLSISIKRKELERLLDQAKQWVEHMDAGLKAMSEEDRLVLDRLFIHKAKDNVNRLCEELCVDKTTVYRRRDEALRRFTLTLYGAMES